ncbi:unnamed protein product [Porites lobata]|uniref:Uncharacterized protein n=1 Tax=Porites lobata TaxID=104759 RepID=A0ABN8QCP3_9CNID|nr:unnamed protein product [Porites lobata]
MSSSGITITAKIQSTAANFYQHVYQRSSTAALSWEGSPLAAASFQLGDEPLLLHLPQPALVLAPRKY